MEDAIDNENKGDVEKYTSRHLFRPTLLPVLEDGLRKRDG